MAPVSQWRLAVERRKQFRDMEEMGLFLRSHYFIPVLHLDCVRPRYSMQG